MQSASLQRKNTVGQTCGIRALATLPWVKALATLAHEAASELNVEAIGSLAAGETSQQEGDWRGAARTQICQATYSWRPSPPTHGGRSR